MKQKDNIEMVKKLFMLAALLSLGTHLYAQSTPDSFSIRGVLPWYNFLSGPTAWNVEDYEAYLDECQAQGIEINEKEARKHPFQ